MAAMSHTHAYTHTHTPGVSRTARTSSTRPSYMSVWMIERISSGPSATLEMPDACTLSVIAFSVLMPCSRTHTHRNPVSLPADQPYY